MVAPEQHLYQIIVLPRKLATGSIHNYNFWYCPLVGILFEVPRIQINSMTNCEDLLRLKWVGIQIDNC